MKLGIVGCGLNSDYHINFAKAYPGSEIVGVVDRDQDRAKECAARHGTANVFTTIRELVDHDKPDVIHIVTPPKTHFALAKEAIELKCNVLVEKPLALNYLEAKTLFDLSERHGVRLCAVHNHFFDPCMVKAHDLVKSGEAGKVINVESYYGINTRIPAFRDYPVPNQLPWIYDLPGSVYQDFMAHPLYVLLEYTGRAREIKVMQQSHGVLPQGMPDEIRILINGENAFGVLAFSFAAQPHLHFVKIYGTKMMIEVDINTMTTVTHPVSSLPKAAQKATYNLDESWQLIRGTSSAVYRFLTGKLKPYQGMKELIHRFYDSIKNNTSSPVSREQALLVIETMDEIWKQLNVVPLKFETFVPESRFPLKHPEKILVTGGTGFLGRRIVETLVGEGYGVRVLARKLSNVDSLRNMGVEIYWGDVADPASLGAAFRGIDIVVHSAAGTSGRKRDCETGTIQGTRNVIRMCRENPVKKMIYISSCSVYGVADFKKNQVVNEGAALEKHPERRGDYSASKQEADILVQESMQRNGVPIVILRPGTIYGPGGDLYTPMMGFSLANKLFVVIGNGKFELPFAYVDNVAQAVIKSIECDEANNRIFNVVDAEKINKKEYMKRVIKKIYPGSKTVYLPISILYSITWMQEIFCKAMKREPFLTRYRLVSSQRSISYDNSRIKNTLGWRPTVSVEEAFNNLIAHETKVRHFTQ